MRHGGAENGIRDPGQTSDLLARAETRVLAYVSSAPKSTTVRFGIGLRLFRSRIAVFCAANDNETYMSMSREFMLPEDRCEKEGEGASVFMLWYGVDMWLKIEHGERDVVRILGFVCGVHIGYFPE